MIKKGQIKTTAGETRRSVTCRVVLCISLVERRTNWGLFVPAQYMRQKPAISIPAVYLFDLEQYDQPRLNSWVILPLENVEAHAAVPVVSSTPTHTITRLLPPMTVDHGYPDHSLLSVLWHLADDSVRIGKDLPEVTAGAPQTVTIVWTKFGADIRALANHSGTSYIREHFDRINAEPKR